MGFPVPLPADPLSRLGFLDPELEDQHPRISRPRERSHGIAAGRKAFKPVRCGVDLELSIYWAILVDCEV